MKKAATIIILCLIPVYVYFRFFTGSNSTDGGLFLVTKVIDGDTVELKDRGQVRLLGIDAPEEGDLYHDSAKNFLTDLTLGKEIGLAFDYQTRDGYGRLLAYLFLDSVFINEAIVRAGMAQVYLFPENCTDRPKTEALIAAQRQAMTESAGIWKLPSVEAEFYLGNRLTFRFHRPECGAVKDIPKKGLIRFEKRTDAFREGYSACRNCRP